MSTLKYSEFWKRNLRYPFRLCFISSATFGRCQKPLSSNQWKKPKSWLDRLRSVCSLLDQHKLEKSFELEIFRDFSLKIPKSLSDKYVKTLKGKLPSFRDYLLKMEPLIKQERTEAIYYPKMARTSWVHFDFSLAFCSLWLCRVVILFFAVPFLVIWWAKLTFQTGPLLRRSLLSSSSSLGSLLG